MRLRQSGERFTARKVTSAVRDRGPVLAGGARDRRAASARTRGRRGATSNSRWPSMASSSRRPAVTVALRGARSRRARSPKNPPGPEGRDLAAVALDPGLPVDDHEELGARRALADDDLPGVDVDVLGQLRHHRCSSFLEQAEKSGTWSRCRRTSRCGPWRASCHGLVLRLCGGQAVRAGNSESRMKVDSVTLKSGSGLHASSRRTPAAISNPLPHPHICPLWRHVTCPRPSESTSAPPTPSSRSSRPASPSSSPTPRVAAPPRRSSPSRRPARSSSARSPSARRSPTPIARSGR